MADFPSDGHHASGLDSWRIEAWEMLNRMQADGAYVSRQFRGVGSEMRNAPRITESVTGITRQRRWLDFLIDSFAHGSGNRLEPGLRQALRMGIYDLLFTDTAQYAAVNQTVELVKRMVRPQAARLANGVLRTIIRKMDRLPSPNSPHHAENLAIIHSHPTWLVRRWLSRFGEEETISLLKHNNRRPIYTVRLNMLKGEVADTRAELETVVGNLHDPLVLEDCIRVANLGPLLRSDLLKNGLIAVQDEAAMLVVRLLDPKQGDRLLDMCAAPGGKALYAAERMGNIGMVLAMDKQAARLLLLKRSARLHDLSIIKCVVGDARKLSDEGPFDAVLLDAPCTGTGVLSKRADLRWNRTKTALDEICRLQGELLDAAAAQVGPGGRLVYATCSIEEEENQMQVQHFLDRHPGFQLEIPEDTVPGSLVKPEGWMEILPHKTGTDGAFAARLVRK